MVVICHAALAGVHQSREKNAYSLTNLRCYLRLLVQWVAKSVLYHKPPCDCFSCHQIAVCICCHLVYRQKE